MDDHLGEVVVEGRSVEAAVERLRVEAVVRHLMVEAEVEEAAGDPSSNASILQLRC